MPTNPTLAQWLELENYFRSWASKYCQMIVGMYPRSEESSREEALLKVSQMRDSFRRTWRLHFNVASIDLAEEFREDSWLFRSNRALIEDALRVTRAEWRLWRELRARHGAGFCIENVDQEKSFMSLAAERYSLRRRASFVIDHAAYALYVAWQPESLIIVPDDRPALLRALALDPDSLAVVSPRQFEELVAYVYETLGCRVQLTQQSRDYGADVLVWHPAPFGSETLIAVQVKRYAKHRRVGIKELFELHGAVTHYHADTGQLISSSNFTGPARRFADSNRYGLVNAQALYGEILRLFGRPLVTL
jgi:HJR/Mrr/RecB family endonuclease